MRSPPFASPVPPPDSEGELLERALALAGRPLGELAAALGLEPPPDLRRAKGWVGRLIEAHLGASAHSLPEPDFQSLGIELKTIPVGLDGRPLESTYVATAPLKEDCAQAWEQSWVARKLRRVLWVPVEGSRELPLANRRVGTGLLWSPTPEQAAVLRADWEELMDMICLGELERLSAHHGTFLQIRPKAAHSRVRSQGVGEDGAPLLTVPRGFYLRTSFTASILEAHFALPSPG